MPIEVKNVSHVYQAGTPFEAAALKDVSFTVQDGEFVGVIGHTGSGKSTLIQHLNALLKPTSGEIYIDGLRLGDKDVSLRDVRRRVGLVFQYPEYQLFEETVVKDVMFGPRNLGLSEEECRARAEEALTQVGLGKELFEKSPFELSGGQKRRVAVAGVMAMKPHILILDEPAAGLDPRGREEILNLVKKIHEGGATTIMVSHSMGDVARLCSRLLVMNKGALAMDGAPRDIFCRSAELTNMGLGLPETAQLADRLRERGFDIAPGAFQREEIEAAILRHFGKGAEK